MDYYTLKEIKMVNEYKKQLIKELQKRSYELFVTVTFKNLVTPTQGSNTIDIAIKQLRYVMSIFERYVLGKHWKRSPIRFWAFFELGRNGVLPHFHILIPTTIGISTNTLIEAFDKALAKVNVAEEKISMNVQDCIYSEADLISYCVKELRFDGYGHFDPIRINTAETLFDIPRSNKPVFSVKGLIRNCLQRKKQKKQNSPKHTFIVKVVQKIQDLAQVIGQKFRRFINELFIDKLRLFH